MDSESARDPDCSPLVTPDCAADIIGLPAAAAVAYEQVYSTRADRSVAPSNDELDLVALALSLHLPIYGVRAPGESAARISEPELMEGMFWGGAARFESRHRLGAMSQLSVKRLDLERVLAQLKSD